MKLADLVQQYTQGGLTLMSLSHKLKHVAHELHAAYPAEGPLLAKFSAHVHGGTAQDSWCDKSNMFRRLITMDAGFRPFCGNQSTCVCNREHQVANKKVRTPERKQLIQERRKQTSLEKYGVPLPSQHESVKAKAEATCMERYGAKAATCNPQVLQKVMETNQQNWGVPYVQQNAEVRAKTKQVFESEYGVACPAQNEQVKQKTRETNVEKYGVAAPFIQPDVMESTRQIFRAQSYESQVISQSEFDPMFTRDTYLQGSPHSEYDFKCVKCGEQFKALVKAQVSLRCYTCHPKRETWGEVAIKQWLQSQQVNFVQWDRTQIKPFELDFWIPDHKLAIEFNGIWHHRHDKIQDRKYHQNKWALCDQKGIRLIQIWEHELHAKPSIIWDRLHHVLGGHAQSVGARTCAIVKLTHEQARTFINAHHLQGHTPTPHVWGLIKHDEIQAVASFVKNRYSDKAEYELARYCVKAGVQVPGGLSRLIRHAQKELGFKSLLSYSNLNWGKGAGYHTTGFVLDHVSVPNYWYFKNINDVQSRLKFQKHKIQGLAPGNTEQEIARNMGYMRFYDAGSAVWIKRF